MISTYNAILVATVTAIKDDKILLIKRKNTGFMDGYYATPGGHVDPEETILRAAVREFKEETNLDIQEADLELFHVLQDENTAPKNYISFRFIVRKWSGKLKLNEPSKSEEIAFFDIQKLPEMLSPYVKRDLEVIKNRGITLSRAERGEFFK